MRYDVPRGPPNILVKFCSKIPLPLPLTGGTPSSELKQAPSGPTTKKILGAPGPPTGKIRGVKLSTSPPPPSISLRQISEIFRPRAGLVPGYNPRDFGNFAGNVAGDIFTFIWSPAPGIYRGQKPIKRSLLFCWILLHTRRDRSRRGQRRDPQYGPPFFPNVPMSHDRRYHHYPRFDGFCDSERPKTPNRK